MFCTLNNTFVRDFGPMVKARGAWVRIPDREKQKKKKKKRKERASGQWLFNHCSVIVTASDQCEIATWAICA
jgi:hypothetical protein